MTTPIACGLCKFWQRLRPQNNWGRCEAVIPLERFKHDTRAYFHYEPGAEPAAVEPEFDTHEQFYCANFSRREIKSHTIVDTVREALRNSQKSSG